MQRRVLEWHEISVFSRLIGNLPPFGGTSYIMSFRIQESVTHRPRVTQSQPTGTVPAGPLSPCHRRTVLCHTYGL